MTELTNSMTRPWPEIRRIYAEAPTFVWTEGMLALIDHISSSHLAFGLFAWTTDRRQLELPAYCLTKDCYRRSDCRHHLNVPAVGPVVAVKTQQGFQASVQIIKKILPQATLIDLHACVRFHGPPHFFLFATFSFFALRLRFPQKRAIRLEK
jgi:hypothetical protein